MKKLLLFLFLIIQWQVVFGQQEALFLKSPSNGQVLSGGSVFNIIWEYSNVENIKIEYSADAGNTWSTVVASYPASAGTYPWLVPVKPTNSGKIKISNVFNSATASLSTGTFSIAQPQLSLDVDTAAVLSPGNVFQLKWNSLSVAKINIAYSKDGGTNFIPISNSFPALAGSFTWIIPELSQNRIQIKVESVDDLNIKAVWNAKVSTREIPVRMKYQGGSFDGHSSLSNVQPQLELLYPKGAENFASFSTQTIRWKSSNIELLKIEFSADSGKTWSLVSESYPAAAQSMDWKVPANTTLKGIIRLTAIDHQGVLAKNPLPFRIPSKSIAIDKGFKPQYVVQEPIPLFWVNNGIESVDLFYKKMKDPKWTLIRGSLPASLLQFVWIPPANLQADSISIKIVAKNFDFQDSTSTPIAIKNIGAQPVKYRGGAYDGFSEASNQKAKLQLTGIKEGTILDAFLKTDLSWNSSDLEFIDIYYSKDGKKTWFNVVKDYAAKAGRYQWQVPYSPTKTAYVKLVSAQDTSLFSISPRFEISESYLKLSVDSVFDGSPNGMIPVRWMQSGLSDLNISIKKADTSKVWTRISSKFLASTGAFVWVNPKSLDGYYFIKAVATSSPFNADSVRVRFSSTQSLVHQDKYKGGAYDGYTSRGNVGKILVTKPQAGEVVIAGSTYLISWKSEKVADSVKIEYTLDNGKTWKVITAAVDAKTGTYLWKVPNLGMPNNYSVNSNGLIDFNSLSAINDCRIRISELNVADALEGLSNNTFKISSTVTQQAQTIAFDPISNKRIGDLPFTLKARSSANLPITYAVVSGPASIKDSTLTITGIGLVSVKASQQGNAQFLPASDVVRAFSVDILASNNFKIKTLSATCKSFSNGYITIKAEKNLPYKATIKSANSTQTYDFRDTLTIKDLRAGKYNICLSIVGISNYEQCFEANISEPEDLSVYTQVNLMNNSLDLKMHGSDTYFINLNGQEYTSQSAQMNLPLKAGLNKIKVSTERECQGVFEEEFYVNERIQVYPNPFSTHLNIKVEGQENKDLYIKVLSSSGIKVFESTQRVRNHLIRLDLSNLESGYYFIVVGNQTYKVIKQ